MTRTADRPKPTSPRTGKTRAWPGPPFEIDRVLLLRAGLAVAVVTFLFLILKVSMIAFGGSAAREAKRIEHATDPAPRRDAPGAPAARPEVAPAR
jgi:hypothetical protein